MLDKTFAYLSSVRGMQMELHSEALEEVKLLRSMPEIVLLAGSSKFKQSFEECAYRLSLQGCIVLGKHVFKPGKEWPLPEQAKDLIHAVQFRMSDLATRVHVINVDGYIGQDTYNLIKYAIRNDTPVTFHEDRVRLLGTEGQVTAHHFMQATRRTVEFEEAAVGGG